MEALTRRSRINFQIVPFACTHQRLLDGLVAGGFFLVRHNPVDTGPQALLDLLESRFGADVRTLRDAAAMIARLGNPPGLASELARAVVLTRTYLCPSDADDPVECVRTFQEAGLIAPFRETLPRLSEVSFSSPAQLAERVDRFLNDPTARAAVSAEQAASVRSRLSYTAGMRRVIAGIHQRLTESAATRPAAQAPAAAATSIARELDPGSDDDCIPVTIHEWHPVREPGNPVRAPGGMAA